MPLLIGIVALALLAIVAAVAVRVRRGRRAAALRRREEEDFDLVFPEGPGDGPVRKTTVGRRIGAAKGRESREREW